MDSWNEQNSDTFLKTIKIYNHKFDERFWHFTFPRVVLKKSTMQYFNKENYLQYKSNTRRFLIMITCYISNTRHYFDINWKIQFLMNL